MIGGKASVAKTSHSRAGPRLFAIQRISSIAGWHEGRGSTDPNTLKAERSRRSPTRI